ncbi:MAG: glycosyltransferase family 2 protein [Tyzzerella sp.]|uniref:Glycosyltransferase family 2 protein n=1 Tax=Candidatus Fimicola merdigallinarum TaxID=2840819 RepID=A0A9D9DZL6_9FIRM|nr:glycosyltransferase family 2 protein [Candidatus Fimicola merdigallinarum]
MEDKFKSISVIVPVYNVEEYLYSCLNSLKNQSYSDMEFILIDDGTPDNSSVICEDILFEDDRFCVIHKLNGGLSSSRNTGILISNSDYISFVDSDDMVIGQPYEFLIEISGIKNADIVCMNITSDINDISDINTKNIECTLTGEEMYNQLCKRILRESAWNKIFIRELFETQLFDENILNEDFLFLVKIANKVNKVVLTDYLGYFYRLREGSITSSGFGKNMIDALYNGHYSLENVPYTSCINVTKEYFLYKILMFLINMPVSYIIKSNKDYKFAFDNLIKLKKDIQLTNLSKRDKYILKAFSKFPFITKLMVTAYMKVKVNV